MKRVFLLCLGLAAGIVHAEAPNSAAPAAPADSQPAAEPKSAEVQSLEPVDAKKDEKAARSSDDDGGVTYSAIGISRVSSGFDNLEPTVNLTAVQGIKVPTIDWIAAEIDFGISIIPGKNDGRTANSGGTTGGGGLPIIGGGGGSGSTASGNFTSSPDDLSFFSIGVFGVLKTPPDWFHGIYAKGKLGYGYVQSSGANGGIKEINDDGSGTAFGIGAGWQYDRRGGVEFLYTQYPAKLDSIGFSVSYGFGGSGDD